ncbi:MAG: FMN-binding glutamate synthase family protein [Candidatus Dadabacteria bacterium]|nr:MAG: FMN-binding glutamate synthase family protein [Candidatus Dadabacteria bacterium]
MNPTDTERIRRREKVVPDRVPGFIERWGRGPFVASAIVLWGAIAILAALWDSRWWWIAILAGPYTIAGFHDMIQRAHAIRRNFPVLGRMRYVLESLRPEVRQYFIESDQEETPFSREKRAIVYSRAKHELSTLPFGTQRDAYRIGYEWINHSLNPKVSPSVEDACAYRVPVGTGRCTQPYAASLLNVSAMSFGALSDRAIIALNRAARKGGFYHNTGEGSISPYHRQGGDLVWQIGTGYFGCRTLDGRFDRKMFAAKAALPEVKMIEIKLSQGAKPGHGGILPGAKVTPEIAEIRGVPVGQDVVSPPGHTAFSGGEGLLEFIADLRDLSGGKPVGFKLCVGSPVEFLALVRLMDRTGLVPDFITVDGTEGGTGAAPLEFANSVGMPLVEGLAFVHNALTGAGLRDQIRLIAAGKLTTGFHVLKLLALGADFCNAARPMMFALGCIQALKCNSNHCPVGVATQNPKLVAGLDIENRTERVYNFQRETVHSVFELLAAAGLDAPDQLTPHHVYRRIATAKIVSFASLYPPIEPRSLVDGKASDHWRTWWEVAARERV